MTVGLSASATHVPRPLMKWTDALAQMLFCMMQVFAPFTSLESNNEHQIDWSVLQQTSKSRETGVSYSYNDTTCEQTKTLKG